MIEKLRRAEDGAQDDSKGLFKAAAFFQHGNGKRRQFFGFAIAERAPQNTRTDPAHHILDPGHGPFPENDRVLAVLAGPKLNVAEQIASSLGGPLFFEGALQRQTANRDSFAGIFARADHEYIPSLRGRVEIRRGEKEEISRPEVVFDFDLPRLSWIELPVADQLPFSGAIVCAVEAEGHRGFRLVGVRFHHDAIAASDGKPDAHVVRLVRVRTPLRAVVEKHEGVVRSLHGVATPSKLPFEPHLHV